MKKQIKITFDFDAADDVDGIQLIIDELNESLPCVVGDGDVFINSFEIEINDI